MYGLFLVHIPITASIDVGCSYACLNIFWSACLSVGYTGEPSKTDLHHVSKKCDTLFKKQLSEK